MNLMNISPEFAAALINALNAIEGATRGAVNNFLKNKYADLESVLNAIKPHLAEYDLGTFQCVRESEEAKVETFAVYKTGEILSMGITTMPIPRTITKTNQRDGSRYEENNYHPQSMTSAITYCRRTGYATAWGVPQIDDDGNAVSGRGEENKSSTKTKPPEIEKPANVPAPGEPWIYYIAKLTPEVEKLLAAANASYDDSIGCYISPKSLGKDFERVRVKTKEQMDKLQLAREAKKLESANLVVDSVEVKK